MVKTRYTPKRAANGKLNKNYWIMLIKCIGWLFLGAAAGYLFFYFFSDFSVSAIDRYKFIQSIFGLRQYEEGMRYLTVILAIIIANTVSTTAYFVLGYFKTLIPLSIITGFFMTILLLAGAAVRQVSIPLEVIILFSIEAFYRCLALVTGEHLYKNKLEKKSVFIVSIAAIVLLLIGAAFYEIYQIFGYIF